MSGECKKCHEHTLDCKCKEGTCELVIYCYKCKSFFQLNPEMIAIALVTKPTIWDIYKYISIIKCKVCEES